MADELDKYDFSNAPPNNNKGWGNHDPMETDMWAPVKKVLKDSDAGKQQVRVKAAEVLMDHYTFKTHEESKVLYVYEDGVYHPKGHQFIHQELEDGIGESVQQRDTEEIVEKIKGRTYTDASEFEPDKRYINLENGIYDLEYGDFIDHSPEHCFINQVPVEYDPDAQCPKIEDFLTEIVEEENLDLLYELIGYCLYRDYPIARAFILYGEGSNGKSKFIELIVNFLGKENISVIPLQDLAENYNVAELHGKLANVDADIPAHAMKDSSIFKKVTGQDQIKGREIYQEPFYFQSYATQIFGANEIPEPSEDNDGFFRRWIIIEFPYKFTDDPEDGHKNKKKDILEDRLSDREMRGLLNKALEGLQRVLEEGFSVQEGMEEKRRKYLRRSDATKTFCEDNLEVALDNSVPKQDIYQLVRHKARELDIPIPSKREITSKLKKEFSVEEKKLTVPRDGEQEWCFRGIKVIGDDSLTVEDDIQHIKDGYAPNENQSEDGDY